MNLKEYVKEDIFRYYSEENKRNGVSIFKMICTVTRHEELWALVCYRIGRWIVLTIKNKWRRKGIIFFWSIANWTIRILSGNIVIYLGADIGKGLYLHYGPIFIGPAKIGEYCNFSMMNVIGFGGRDENYGIPEIGNRVFIGPGAIVTGKIKIGNDVAIGANAVVNKSLPDGCMAGGIPARIINDTGSDQLINIRW
jgi:serine O-acetyltransferase